MFVDETRSQEDANESDNLVHSTPARRKARPPKRVKYLRVALIAVAIGAVLGGGIYFATEYVKTKEDVKRLSDPEEAAKEEIRQLSARVSQLVAVPENETPTLATVEDPAKLADQAFFAQAEKGDKVLIYTQAKRAILYRPSTDRVIESAPVNIGSTPSVDTSTPGATSASPDASQDEE